MTLTKKELALLETVNDLTMNPDDQEKAFMANVLVQATLPHRDPGRDVPVWARFNGDTSLIVKADWEYNRATNTSRCVGLPYGSIPRLLLLWLITEAVKTKEKRIFLGSNLADFMRELELIPTGGRNGSITRLREQMNRLFRAKISFERTKKEKDGKVKYTWLDMQVAPQGEIWWHRDPNQDCLWQSWIELGDLFFNAVCQDPIPLNMNALRKLRKSPLALDVYAWLNHQSYRATRANKAREVDWSLLSRQLGAEYKDMRSFRFNVRKSLTKILLLSPGINVEYNDQTVTIKPKK